MSGKNQHLGYLNMSGSVGCEDCYIGNVITCQWFDALVDISCTVVVTTETDIAEIRLNKAWFQVTDTNGRISNIDTEPIRKSLDSSLCGTIDIATCIGSIASHRTDIYNMAAITLHHTRNY